jgi:hypothetical protein
MNRLKTSGVLALALLLVACAVNPFKTAQTSEQKADALYGEYVIAKEAAGKVLDNPAVSNAVKRAIATKGLATSPAANSLHDAVIKLTEERDKVLLGTSTEAKLLIAAQSLEKWIADAGPLIKSFKTAVEGVK